MLDDEDLYVEFLQKIEGCSNIIQQIISVQSFVDEYFGIGRDETQRVALNQSLPHRHSIKEYKGKNVAMCFERSTLAHNLFKLANQDSMLVMKNGHAYNILKTAKSIVICDVTNLATFKLNNEKFYLPGLRIVSKADAEEFLYGEKVLTLNENPIKQLYPNATDIEIPPIEYSGLKLEHENTDSTELNLQ